MSKAEKIAPRAEAPAPRNPGDIMLDALYALGDLVRVQKKFMGGPMQDPAGRFLAFVDEMKVSEASAKKEATDA